MDLVCVVELEVDILDDEGPDVVAEAVGVEVALHKRKLVIYAAEGERRSSCLGTTENVP